MTIVAATIVSHWETDMQHDLLIRGATLLDGTGADPFIADVAIKASWRWGSWRDTRLSTSSRRKV